MRLLRIIMPLLLTLAVVSCRTTKQVENKSDAGSLPAEALTMKVLENAQTAPAVTAKMRFEIVAGEKNFTLNGSLKMKRDDVIQLSLSFLGMEVGRMEFTRDQVLIVDRFNKQYVRVPYEKVPFLAAANLDFGVLQALFWNELFLPGEPSPSRSLGRFVLSRDDAATVLSVTDAPKLNYRFSVRSADAVIEQTTVSDKFAQSSPSLTWKYGRFARLDGRNFPQQMEVGVAGVRKPYRLTIDLSSLSNSTDWNTRTEVSSRYKEQSVEAILQKLMKL